MTSIRLSHQVKASPDEVFDLADNHENYPKFFQDFGELKWTTPRHKVGTSLKMEANLGGTLLPVELRTTEIVPGHRISGVFTSGLEGRLDWDFRQEDETTWVTLSAEYRMPSRGAVQPRDRGAMDHALCISMQKALAAMKELVESRRESKAA